MLEKRENTATMSDRRFRQGLRIALADKIRHKRIAQIRSTMDEGLIEDCCRDLAAEAGRTGLKFEVTVDGSMPNPDFRTLTIRVWKENCVVKVETFPCDRK